MPNKTDFFPSCRGANLDRMYEEILTLFTVLFNYILVNTIEENSSPEIKRTLSNEVATSILFPPALNNSQWQLIFAIKTTSPFKKSVCTQRK